MSDYITCQYGERTVFGLVCPYKTGAVLKNEEYPCPKGSGTDGSNGVCYECVAPLEHGEREYCAFHKDE